MLSKLYRKLINFLFPQTVEVVYIKPEARHAESANVKPDIIAMRTMCMREVLGLYLGRIEKTSLHPEYTDDLLLQFDRHIRSFTFSTGHYKINPALRKYISAYMERSIIHDLRWGNEPGKPLKRALMNISYVELDRIYSVTKFINNYKAKNYFK